MSNLEHFLNTVLPQKLESLRHDQDGSVSIATVFFVLLFAMLLGMLMNIGRHADREIIMQNGTDAAAYTGGVVLSRGMNTLAYTNHLECDVFGVVAYLREAIAREAEAKAILRLQEIIQKDPVRRQQAILEMELIITFGNHNAAIANRLLPTFESILKQELFPDFQRRIRDQTPVIAAAAANEIIQRHAPANAGLAGNIPARFAMFRSDALAFGVAPESTNPTLPVVDPNHYRNLKNDKDGDDEDQDGDDDYVDRAIEERARLSQTYLNTLNQVMLIDLDRVALLSRFPHYFRGETGQELQDLLGEHPDSNLPFQLKPIHQDDPDVNPRIEDDTMFVGVMYWDQMPERLPGLFENPMDADDVTFSQIRLFVPRDKIVWDTTRPG